MSAVVPAALAGCAAFVLVAVPSRPAGRLALLGGVAPAPTRRGSGLPVLVAGLLALVAAGPIAGGGAALGAGLLRRVVRRRRAERRAAEERQRALEALAVLAADLRAGRTPAEALAAAAQIAVGGTAEALAAAAGAARLAGDVPGALTGTTDAPGVLAEQLAALAACWSVTAVSGSGLAGGVERLEEGLRAAAAQRRAVEAELAGPRATAALLAVLPLGGIGLAAALGADPVHVLLHTPLGLCCLSAGAGLDLLGLVWTGRLASRAVAP